MAKKILTDTSVAVNNIRSLADQVKDQSTTLKTAFDQYGIDNNAYINDTLLDELQDSSTADDSGSFGIGHNSSEFDADNVGDVLKELISAHPAFTFYGASVGDGQMRWNTSQRCVEYTAGDVTIQVGLETVSSAVNKSGVTIPNGAPVMFTGTSGASGKKYIAKMVSDGTYPNHVFVGIATEEILNGAEGKVTWWGDVNGVNTSAWSNGDLLYLNPTTPGTLTNVNPGNGYFKTPIAAVVFSNASAGIITVRCSIGQELGDLNGVLIESVADNEILRYNSSTGLWENDDSLTVLEAAVSALQTADGQNVKKTGDQTIANVKTFTSSPIVPTPTTEFQASTRKFVTDTDATRKTYVDGLDSANVKKTGAQTIADVKTFSSSPVVPTPTTEFQASNKGYADAGLALKANAADVYTKTNMQTSGQSSVHWDNLTNVPNLADSSWKPAVATYNDLPITGNTINDMRIVADDGDGKTAMYRCYATTGAIADQWEKIADLDWTNDHGALVGLGDDDHTQYTRSDGTRAFTGTISFGDNQITDVLVHNSPTAPTSVESKLWYDTANHVLKVYDGTAWVNAMGQGAVIRDVEIVATSGQTIFDVGVGGTLSYDTGANTMNVYRKNTDGYYELLDESDYVETDSETVTLNTGATAGDSYYFKWQKNVASIVDNLPDDSVTDSKLATDNKVGSLATLLTTIKSSIVAAINELVGSIATVAGNLSSHTSNTSNPHSVTIAQIGAQAAGTYNTIIGTDSDMSLPTATVLSTVTLTDGVITAFTTRTLTIANLGITASTTELNYTDGVTSNIQTQLNAKQKTITSGTASPSGGSDGDIYLQYE